MDKIIAEDLFRFNRKKGMMALLKTALFKLEFRHVFLLRWYQKSRFKLLSRLLLRRSCLLTGIQIGWKTKIGKGFLIVHYGDIAVNNAVVMGDYCTISHGATIGIASRGPRAGCPTLGNYVWVGSNAVIVGNITIGDDVLIAPLAYVNVDVPSHSIVIGNPAKIISREHATAGYITNVPNM
ncbi:serine acetyltransferase [Bacteroides heparinolyticus]|uniref:serine acetyltransferase n=1 Tax=Prevotella heparinolytica TaxID=28113 RepID=UPI0035A1CF63